MFINPHDAGMMSFLKQISGQGRIHILMVASDGSNVSEVMKASNIFAIPAFIEDLQALAREHPEVDFTMTKRAFESQHLSGDQ